MKFVASCYSETYFIGCPGLSLCPVQVVPDVPPLDLQWIRGYPRPSEGAGHLHILPSLGCHVMRHLCEHGWKHTKRDTIKEPFILNFSHNVIFAKHHLISMVSILCTFQFISYNFVFYIYYSTMGMQNILEFLNLATWKWYNLSSEPCGNEWSN